MKILVVDGVATPYSIEQLIADNPRTQFPAEPSAQFLAGFNVYDATIAPEPAYDPATQRLEAGDVVSVGESFVQQWNVVNLTNEEQADRLNELRQEMKVTRLAARLALIDNGLWDSIPAVIDAIPDATQKAVSLAYFEDAQNWERLDATVIALGAALGLSESQIDDLFTLAASKM